MRTATAVLSQSVDACWRAFTDARLLLAWVPGLRRATVISTGAMNMPREILFEFAESRTYTLIYDYDVASHEVRWQPQLGKRDAVSGRARFTTDNGATRMEYALEQGDGRTEAERALVERFYDVMSEREPALARLHEHTPDGKVERGPRDRFALFLIGWLGGPQDYIAQHGHPRLRMRHGRVPVNIAMRDAWLRSMTAALDSEGVTGELRGFLEDRFAQVADFLRNVEG